MRYGRTVLASVLVLLFAAVTYADGISPTDPKILVGRGVDSTPITTLQFGVAADPMGGGIFNFDNATGQDWVGLILTVTFPNAADAMAVVAACSSDVSSDIFAFTGCSAERHGRTLTITLSGGDIAPCTTNPCSTDSEFFVNLDDLGKKGVANGLGGWGKNNDIEVQAITTPEPGTLVLLVTGLGGFWLRRRFH